MEIAALGLRVDGVRDIDQASASLDRFTKSGSEAEKSVGGVGKTSRESSRSVSDLGKTSGSTSTNFTALARSAAGVAASLGLIVSVSSVFRSMVDTTSSFENSMAKVRAITRATDADMVRLSKTARELGASTVFSAAEAADGLQFLGMAGMSAAESISAIPGILDLAAASAMGLAQTADIATNIMSGFEMGAAEAGRVADILAAASSRANTDVAQLGEAMVKVGPVSRSLGISLEDTAAAVGILSDAGLQGAVAGTTLRGVFASLSKPVGDAEKILDKYNLTAADVNPQVHGLATALERLRPVVQNTGDAIAIFGREAATGGIVLANSSSRISEFGDELRDAEGEARRMAETMQDTLTGDTKELSSAIEELLLNLNDKTGLQAMLRGSTQRSTELVSGFNTLLNESELLNETLRLISSTAGALIDAVKLMVGGIVDAVREFGEMIGVIKLAESALPGLTRAVRFFADGIQDASIWLRFFGNVVKRAFTGDVKAIQNSWAELQEAFKERVAERETRRLNDAVEDLLKNTELFGTFEGAVTDAVGQLAEDAIDAAGGVEELDDELQKLIKSLQSLVDSYDKSGARVRQLIKDHAGLRRAMSLGLPGAKEAMDAYYDSMITVERRTETLAVTTEESAEWMATSFERGVERMRDGIGDFFERMIVDGKASFSDLTDLFKKMIAEMIATAAANRIMIGLGFMGAAGGASAGGLGSGGGGIGLSDILSMKNLVNVIDSGFASVGNVVLQAGGLISRAGGYFATAASNMGMGLVAAGDAIGGAIGMTNMSAGAAAGLGGIATAGAGWAGGRVGSDLGLALTGKEGSGWGAAGGSAIGAYVGSIIPGLGTMIGAALGGLIGGVVDSIFGTSGWNTTRGGLQLGFGDEGFNPMQWERQTKRGGLFGSTKRRYRFNELDDELDAALSETYDATLDSVRELYGILGVAVEDGVLEGVQIATLQIGTAGKSKQSQEAIEQQITQWFADLQEAAVQAIDPSLSVETLSVYAGSLASVNEVFGAIGLSAYDVSIEGGKAAAHLLELSGGIENLLTATDFYYQNFYSAHERMGLLTEQTAAAFEAMGLALPESRQGFRDIVEGIDQSTEEGRQLFLQLLNIAPAFADLTGRMGDLDREADELRIELLKLSGDMEGAAAASKALATDGMSALEIAAWERNQSLLQQIEEQKRAQEELMRAEQDQIRAALEAADAAQKLATEQERAAQQMARAQQQALSSIERSIGGLRERIILDQLGTPEAQYGYYKSQIDAMGGMIGQMSSPEAISNLVGQMVSMAGSAYSLLDEEGQQGRGAEYLTFLDNLQHQSTQAIEKAEQKKAEQQAKILEEAMMRAGAAMAEAVQAAIEEGSLDLQNAGQVMASATHAFAGKVNELNRSREVNA